MTAAAHRIEALGDSALLVTLGARIDPELNRRARALAAALDAARRDATLAIGRPVTAYASVLVPFDPLSIDEDEVRATVTGLLAERAAPAAGHSTAVEIAVRYDGPDLADVASLNGLRPSDVVAAHSSVEYEVFFLGFAPGFAYLGTLPDAIATPRLPSPRVRVPAGSVGIAGSQTGIYPFEMPGGWRLIGRTDAVMWDLHREPPALLRPGDRVRFVPVEVP